MISPSYLVSRLKAAAQVERNAFSHLSEASRSLLLSFVGYHFAVPLLLTFMNTFLWSQGKDLGLVCLYNATLFGSLACGFYCNALALRLARPDVLFRIMSAGLVVPPLFLYSLPSLNRELIICIACVYGLVLGLYWSNRSLELAQNALSSVAAPFICGWALVASQELFGVDESYSHVITLLIAGSILVGGALGVRTLPRVQLRSVGVRPARRGAAWKESCRLLFLQGLSDVPLHPHGTRPRTASPRPTRPRRSASPGPPAR